MALSICLISFQSMGQYNEKYRPQFHFSPQKGWIGDPDGLIFYKGLYHLFWWGHAVSKDLIHWEELPYPMKGDDGSFVYFTGSVIVDKNNTAGFGDSTIIAVYTMHKKGTNSEMQALSYSTDGINFQFYDKNPVLDIGNTSFRDPTVFWHTSTGRWVMAVSMPDEHKVSFYGSGNLKDWKHLSDFGPMGAHTAAWEVPDLFQLPVDGNNNNKKWILTVGQGPNRVQYFTGDFDGTQFKPDTQTIRLNGQSNTPLWIDYGTDFYAARTWRNIGDEASNPVTLLGWMGNWSYARQVPTSWGRGFEAVPRILSLKTFKQGLRIVQQPVEGLKKLRQKEVVIGKKNIAGTVPLKEFEPTTNSYELNVDLIVNPATVCGLNLLVGEGRKLTIGYDALKEQLFIDRTNCSDFNGDSVFNKKFPAKMAASLQLTGRRLQLHVLVDKSSVEVFANNGAVALSCLTFPSENQRGLELFSNATSMQLNSLHAWPLASIWTGGNPKVFSGN